MASQAAVAETAQAVYRKDYKPVPYSINTVGLVFVLNEDATVVKSTLQLSRTPAAGSGSPALELQGAPEVELLSLTLDGSPVPASGYERTAKGGLTLKSVPTGATFTLVVETKIKPQDNTSLEGLYKSSGNYCTQCEAEGFRRITFFLDRPDVMSVYTTRVEADKAKYPVLLSNGNLVDSGDLGGGRHFAVWHDPFVKPCYLFALVAGDLACTEDKFVTASGTPVALRIWTQHHNASKTAHAMESLKKSMTWDETRFGLEYDLSLFNIVAVDDFNMGAMENKSLNIFNSRLVLATPDTATDGDYMAIESVIGHEYFHNWTGNRVTCQNWFQLSLKEGLTVYRDQEFSADVNSRGVQRLSEVARLRSAQFPQDSGPMAHPVRPESYVKMDNFYTVTVYEKGAEVVRMYATLLGRAGFRKGMDLYFKRHDGQAVTCDDFLAAMADANGVDLSDFARWYAQAGTPRVKVSTAYDAATRQFTLRCSQHTPATPGQTEKLPVVIPLTVGLLDPVTGADLKLSIASGKGSLNDGATTAVLRFSAAEETFVLSASGAKDTTSAPVPSLLRDFSAPVILECDDLTEDKLVFLMAHDSDPFNRWDAGQTLARRLLLRLVAAHGAGDKALEVPQQFVDAMRAVLVSADAPDADKAFIARAMALPTESELVEALESADPIAIHEVRKHLVRTLATALQPQLQAALTANTSTGAYKNDGPSRAQRSLKNTALAYLSSLRTPDIAAEALRRYKAADNMTDQLAALASLSGHASPQREEAMAAFAAQWSNDPLVMNKWFSIRGGEDLPGNVGAVRELLNHPCFDAKNPNKWYSLLGAFCGSAVNFHAADGSGYAFLADCVVQLDKSNAQVAARMAGAFTRWRRYDGHRQTLMKAQLERLSKIVTSDNVLEIVTKSLA